MQSVRVSFFSEKIFKKCLIFSFLAHGILLLGIASYWPGDFAPKIEAAREISVELESPQTAIEHGEQNSNTQAKEATAEEKVLGREEASDGKKEPEKLKKPEPAAKPQNKSPKAAPAQTGKIGNKAQNNSNKGQAPAKSDNKDKGQAQKNPVKSAAPLKEFCPAPSYPQLARKRGYEGTVRIKCEIGETGTVINAVLLKSSGHKALDDAAMTAVKKWKFSPAVIDGSPAKDTVIVPVKFKLR